MTTASYPSRFGFLRVRWRWLALVVLLVLLGAGGWYAWTEAALPVYPGAQWTWKPPEKAGFSAEKLAAFSERSGGAGCIVHGGEMIHEWGDTEFLNDAASSTKAFYTFLVLEAIENGLIGSIHDPVVTWAPELMDLNPDLGHKDRAITFHHLLSQTSGYGLEETPGEAFAYNDHATGLLAWLLFYRVYGRAPMDYDTVLNSPMLGDLIQFEHDPTVIHRNTPRGRLRISARDFARFGLLHLREGRWDRRQVIRQDLFRKAMSYTIPPDMPRTSGVETEEVPNMRSIGGEKDEKGHLGCLGYYWWHNRVTPDGTRLLPAAPPRTFLGSGHGGRFALVVIPEYDLVVVWFNVFPREQWIPFDQAGRFRVNDVIYDLLAARRYPKTPGGCR